MSEPVVGIIMGSESDFETMKHAVEVLKEFGVPHEVSVVSAHRTPERMFNYAADAAGRGLKLIIAGAGGAAHLPGMVSALTPLPVLGVPVESKALHGLDSLLSIVQMPGGVPTATFAIGASGAKNAALFAVRVLAAAGDAALGAKLQTWRQTEEEKVIAQSDKVGKPG
jgi:5-(carboxyamino)imidazole ribonucleotide mutase